jgi:hypothetical protein
MSAGVTGVVGASSGIERGVFGGGFRIRFHGESLHGLQGRGNGFLIGLGAPHFRIETLVDLTQRGIVRTDLGIASSESCAGAELVGRDSFLSLSTIQTAVPGDILA